MIFQVASQSFPVAVFASNLDLSGKILAENQRIPGWGMEHVQEDELFESLLWSKPCDRHNFTSKTLPIPGHVFGNFGMLAENSLR